MVVKIILKITAGVDAKASPNLVLHEQIFAFLTFGKDKTKQKTNIWYVLTPKRIAKK